MLLLVFCNLHNHVFVWRLVKKSHTWFEQVNYFVQRDFQHRRVGGLPLFKYTQTTRPHLTLIFPQVNQAGYVASSSNKRIQSQGSTLCANSQNFLHRIKSHGRGLIGKAMSHCLWSRRWFALNYNHDNSVLKRHSSPKNGNCYSHFDQNVF